MGNKPDVNKKTQRGEGGAGSPSYQLCKLCATTLEIKAPKWRFSNGLGETTFLRMVYFVLCKLYSVLLSFIFHITTTLVEINCSSMDNLAQVHTHQGSLRQLTKAFLLMNLCIRVQPLLVQTVSVCVDECIICLCWCFSFEL